MTTLIHVVDNTGKTQVNILNTGKTQVNILPNYT
jgi:hypothetical protein